MAVSVAAPAREQLGRIEIDNLVLRPQFTLLEPAKANFELGESLFAVRWEMDARVRAVFAVGSKTLLGTSVHFADELPEELGFVEAYGEYESDYGTFRAGLQPVGLGFEGNVREADMDMPRSLIYQRRLAPLRDIGVSYEVDYNGYFTRLMVHNGESGANEDGRPWYTGRWGWGTPDRWRVGFGGQTGTTKPESTSVTDDELAGVNEDEEAQWRMGGPFIVWTPHRWRVALEAYLGELVQNEDLRKFSAGNLTVAYTGRKWFVGLRYDHFDPNHDNKTDLERNVSLALGLTSERRTSRLYLVGTKVFEESGQVPNDELLLIWHLTPEIPVAIPGL
jgi:hypothetical protein